ncbi:hypothetical protein P168DRAFT_120031 [Aspergillus campestris IBT 28561]|uniref:Uncharacterized protein n=1 Tax=Aspergillus campestris (strain IBT 28561) TaxID=1392248 RepID=A0A2I1DAG9_ASPC2|nr:uncharacterized protein P168DRAFT_120031 [Aspergillus campestris IBT 28561]PKY06868.1 hypothetical protein P168DRAFT_120031 [Aspergillus campestris IBT 28561]
MQGRLQGPARASSYRCTLTLCMCAYVYEWLDVCMYVCMYVCLDVCRYVRMNRWMSSNFVISTTRGLWNLGCHAVVVLGQVLHEGASPNCDQSNRWWSSRPSRRPEIDPLRQCG